MVFIVGKVTNIDAVDGYEAFIAGSFDDGVVEDVLEDFWEKCQYGNGHCSLGELNTY